MKVDLQTGWLDGARQHVSPNYDKRPDDMAISLLVIHSISLPPGEFAGNYIDQFFCNQLSPAEHPYFQNICQLKVSSHLFIRREGEIVQYVPFHQRAWHAGASAFMGQDNCNDYSIGIELEGDDDTPYTEIQYQQLSEVIKLLIKAYPALNGENIVGHCDISPGRKTDPGPAFEWSRMKRLLSYQ